MNRKPGIEPRPHRTALLRWELIAISFVMLLILAAASIPAWGADFQPAQIIVYGSLLLLTGFLLYISLFRWRTLERRLSLTEADLDRTKGRLSNVIRLGKQLSKVGNEDEAIGLALETCLVLTPARGISYLPFDDRGLVRAIVWRGDLPLKSLDLIEDELAMPDVRDKCPKCTAYQGGLHKDCKLPISRPPGVEEVYCLPVSRNERSLGLLSIFFGEGEELDDEAEPYLIAVVDELTLVIEGLRLRRLDPTSRLPAQASGSSGLTSPLPAVAEVYLRFSRADFLILKTNISPVNPGTPACSFGRAPVWVEPQVMELLASVFVEVAEASEYHVAEDPAGGGTGYRLVVAPLRSTDGEIFGGVVMGWGTSGEVPLPEVTEVSAAADALAMVAGIPGYLKDFEYRAVMGERNRFAREIHDGLAQSLGYLKLLTARMAGFLAAGDLARLTASLAETRAALGEAYEDARSAIDDLVLSPESGLGAWLEQVTADFEGTTGIPVTLSGEDSANEPPAEVQAQMIRILQEALTNVRKHASAGHVWIGWYSRNGVLTLEVRDDGRGFRPDLLLSSSQHGLLSMQERAELIGGKLQIVSSDGEGTIIRLRLVQEVPESET